MVGWVALIARTPWVLAPLALVGTAGAAVFVTAYRTSKWVSGTVLRVKTEQQDRCATTARIGLLPLPMAYIVYREVRYRPERVIDALHHKIGSNSYWTRAGMRAISESVVPALKFHGTSVLVAAALGGLGHSVSLFLWCPKKSPPPPPRPSPAPKDTPPAATTAAKPQQQPGSG